MTGFTVTVTNAYHVPLVMNANSCLFGWKIKSLNWVRVGEDEASWFRS